MHITVQPYNMVHIHCHSSYAHHLKLYRIRQHVHKRICTQATLASRDSMNQVIRGGRGCLNSTPFARTSREAASPANASTPRQAQPSRQYCIYQCATMAHATRIRLLLNPLLQPRANRGWRANPASRGRSDIRKRRSHKLRTASFGEVIHACRRV
jgi:hypothetical protein